MIIADAANWDNSIVIILPGSPVTQTAPTTEIYLNNGPRDTISRCSTAGQK